MGWSSALRTLAQAPWKLGLVTRFTIVGVVIGVAVASGVAWIIEDRVTDLRLTQMVARASDHVELGTTRYLTAADFQPPYTPSKLQELATRLDPWLARAREHGIIRLYLLSRDGTILYSDVASARGQVIPPARLKELSAALAGAAGAGVSPLTASESADLRAGYGEALEAYVPVKLDGQVVGVYEIYQDLAPVRPIRSLVWGVVAGGFGILLLSLLVVVRGASARIARQQAEMLARHEKWARLEESNQTLAQTTQAKSEFLATMSHELRTPLNSIIGFSELLRDDPGEGPTAAQRRQFANNIQQSGRHLLGLVNDILDLSKVEAGRLELHPTTFSVASAVYAVLAVIRPVAEQKDLTLVTHVASDVAGLHADEARFKQVLYNLLSNAVKFTPAGGQVEVTAQGRDGEVEVVVVDTGIGIAPEDQERIFRAFHQLDSSLSRRYEGTGLGLALAGRLVELQGGRIWVESEPGKGSRFHFTVPLTAQAAAVPLDAPAVPEHTRPLTVLVVDDEALAGELVAALLEPEGYTVLRAEDGEEGVALAATYRPDVVLLDLLLPGLNGFGVLDRLKADGDTREIPIVVLTGKELTDDERAALDGRIAALVAKDGFTRERFLAEIRRSIGPAAASVAQEGGR
jgi:signal transduction histidine kinase